MKFNKKAQNVIPILIGVVLIIVIFSFSVVDNKGDKITGAVVGMESVSGDMVKVTGMGAGEWEKSTGVVVDPDSLPSPSEIEKVYNRILKNKGLVRAGEYDPKTGRPAQRESPKLKSETKYYEAVKGIIGELKNKKGETIPLKYLGKIKGYLEEGGLNEEIRFKEEGEDEYKYHFPKDSGGGDVFKEKKFWLLPDTEYNIDDLSSLGVESSEFQLASTVVDTTLIIGSRRNYQFQDNSYVTYVDANNNGRIDEGEQIVGYAGNPSSTAYQAYNEFQTLIDSQSTPDISLASCFLPTTPITLSNGNKKQIQNIQKGDKVLSYDLENKKPVVSEVLNTYSHLENEYLIVNGKIKVTPYHNMYINGEWKQIGDAEVGDKLMDKDGNEIEIISIEKAYSQEGVMVYDLEIDKFHYYFAEGVLVHNSELGTTSWPEPPEPEKYGDINVIYEDGGVLSFATDNVDIIDGISGGNAIGVQFDVDKLILDYSIYKLKTTLIGGFNKVFRKEAYERDQNILKQHKSLLDILVKKGIVRKEGGSYKKIKDKSIALSQETRSFEYTADTVTHEGLHTQYDTDKVVKKNVDDWFTNIWETDEGEELIHLLGELGYSRSNYAKEAYSFIFASDSKWLKIQGEGDRNKKFQDLRSGKVTGKKETKETKNTFNTVEKKAIDQLTKDINNLVDHFVMDKGGTIQYYDSDGNLQKEDFSTVEFLDDGTARYFILGGRALTIDSNFASLIKSEINVPQVEKYFTDPDIKGRLNTPDKTTKEIIDSANKLKTAQDELEEIRESVKKGEIEDYQKLLEKNKEVNELANEYKELIDKAYGEIRRSAAQAQTPGRSAVPLPLKPEDLKKYPGQVKEYKPLIGNDYIIIPGNNFEVWSLGKDGRYKKITGGERTKALKGGGYARSVVPSVLDSKWKVVGNAYANGKKYVRIGDGVHEIMENGDISKDPISSKEDNYAQLMKDSNIWINPWSGKEEFKDFEVVEDKSGDLHWINKKTGKHDKVLEGTPIFTQYAIGTDIYKEYSNKKTNDNLLVDTRNGKVYRHDTKTNNRGEEIKDTDENKNLIHQAKLGADYYQRGTIGGGFLKKGKKYVFDPYTGKAYEDSGDKNRGNEITGSDLTKIKFENGYYKEITLGGQTYVAYKVKGEPVFSLSENGNVDESETIEDKRKKELQKELDSLIIKEQRMEQFIQSKAQQVMRYFLNQYLGKWANDKIYEMCKDEVESSEPSSSTPANVNPGPMNPASQTSIQQALQNKSPDCVGSSETTLTAQGTKTEAASKFSYDISWTIAPCKEDTSFDVYIANTETDREMIWSDTAKKGKPKAVRKKFSKDKDYKDVCIKVSDYSIGNRGYVCFPMV